MENEEVAAENKISIIFPSSHVRESMYVREERNETGQYWQDQTAIGNLNLNHNLISKSI